MGYRASRSGIYLTERDAAIIKGMLLRGDRQHDIAAFFGVNGGRIGEIATAQTFGWVKLAPPHELPPSGPYPVANLLGELEKMTQVIKHARCKLSEHGETL